MPIDVTVSRAVRAGDLIFTCGQVDLDKHGQPQHAGDLVAQTTCAMRHLYSVLDHAGAHPQDIAHLHVFYHNDGNVDEREYRCAVAATLHNHPSPVTVFTPLPYFFYPGVEVEIDAIAIRCDANISAKKQTFPGAVQHDDLIFAVGEPTRDRTGRVSDPDNLLGQTEQALATVEERLAECGAHFNDVLKITIYLSDLGQQAISSAENLIAAHFAESRPVSTTVILATPGLPGETIRLEAIAVRAGGEEGAQKVYFNPEQHWQRSETLPYSQAIRCGNLMFIGGQLPLDTRGKVLHRDDLANQTRVVMEYMGKLLHGTGVDFNQVVKVNTYYTSSGDPAELHTNLKIRCAYFTDPGPASTGIPVPGLRPDGAMISVDAIVVAT